MGTYPVVLQMGARLHRDNVAVVETTIELPDNYQPLEGSWLFHPIVNGLVPVGPSVFDAVRNVLVVIIPATVFDPTATLEEWLEQRPGWQKADREYIEIKVQEEQDDHKGYD